MKNTDINKLTRAQLIALFESGAVKVATPKREKTAYRIANPDKVAPGGVRTPLAGLDDMFGKGLTFATWLDNSTGDPVKRRAYKGDNWLLVDSRGISKDDVLAIATAWADGKKLKSQKLTGATGGVDGRPAVAVPVFVFTVASK